MRCPHTHRLKFVWLFLAVCSLQTAVYGNTQPFYNYPSTILQELAKFNVQVTDEKLITADGKEYPRIHWKNDFEKQLFRKLEDPKKSTLIYTAYENYLLPALTHDASLQSRFKQWIIDNAFLLGSVNHPGLEVLRQYTEFSVLLEDPQSALTKACEQFFNTLIISADKSLHHPLSQEPRPHFKSIAFITTSGGGGHYTTSKSMEAEIQQRYGKQAKVRSINHAAEQKTCDPLYLATGKMTADDIYNEFFQKENDPQKANLYWSLYSVLQDYIPFTCNRQIKDKINQTPTDLIISTMPHFDIHADLAYSHDVPLRVTGTDYTLAYATYQSALYSSEKLIRFWVTSGEREIFQHFLDTPFAASEQATQVKDSLTAATENVISGKQMPLYLDDKFQVLGFPLRKPFDLKYWQHTSVQQLKQERGIPTRKKVVILTMGANGVGTVADIALRAQSLAYAFRDEVHFVVVCGKNHLSRSIVESFISKSSRKFDSGFSMESTGYLSMEDMAKLFYMSDAIISKPGGATTAEASAMRTPMLITEAHMWEAPNQAYLLRNQLGQVLEEKWNIVPELQKMLDKNLKQTSSFEPLSWKTRLQELLSLDT
ncbi:MAG: hypothetical protein OXT67_02445 [Zetaproteobacteria bacterium]|nr:hypothetical protein [Zetaproteobacteria bacterium]